MECTDQLFWEWDLFLTNKLLIIIIIIILKWSRAAFYGNEESSSPGGPGLEISQVEFSLKTWLSVNIWLVLIQAMNELQESFALWAWNALVLQPMFQLQVEIRAINRSLIWESIMIACFGLIKDKTLTEAVLTGAHVIQYTYSNFQNGQYIDKSWQQGEGVHFREPTSSPYIRTDWANLETLPIFLQ